MSDDFDWKDVEDDILIHSVGAIAVYTNPRGDVVIRQEASMFGDDDAVVVVPIAYVESLIEKLRALRDESDA